MSEQGLFIFKKTGRNQKKWVGLSLARTIEEAQKKLNKYDVSGSDVKPSPLSAYKQGPIELILGFDKGRFKPIFEIFKSNGSVFCLRELFDFSVPIKYEGISSLLSKGKIKLGSLVKIDTSSLQFRVYKLLLLKAFYVTDKFRRLKLPKDILFFFPEEIAKKEGLESLFKETMAQNRRALSAAEEILKYHAASPAQFKKRIRNRLLLAFVCFLIFILVAVLYIIY
jgi:hypothetical protein